MAAFGHEDAVGDVLEVFVCIRKFGDNLDFKKIT
jgi:hypothetical protein